jgi:hypothetical protein
VLRTRKNVPKILPAAALTAAVLAVPAAAVESGPYLPAALTGSEWSRLPTTHKF